MSSLEHYLNSLIFSDSDHRVIFTNNNMMIEQNMNTILSTCTIFRLSSLDEEQGYDMDDLDHEVDEWEISRDRLVLREVIGTGAFGTVWRAGLSEPDGKPGKQIVAAKCFTRKNLNITMFFCY